MNTESQIIDFIRRGYSNRYIRLLLNVTVDEIEDIRERAKKSLGIYGREA